MSKSLIFFLTSILLSILLLPVFYVNGKAADSSLEALVQKCIAESESAARNSSGATRFTALICLPSAISTIPYPQQTATQREIWSAPNGSGWISKWGDVAFGLFLIGAIPLAWRFLLNRIKELSKALRGID